MRVDAIELEWFRGAADSIALEANSKSIVVYGGNGSGKSSFVDAVEFVLNNGRINHLAHEYSGRNQEKAVQNTHRPRGRNSHARIKFNDGSALLTEIQSNGSWTKSGAESPDVETWDYRRTVLRQDEVAQFIHDTKGGKYSALLPLLGLGQLEIAAENLRQLARVIEQESRLRDVKATLKATQTRRAEVFGSLSDDEILGTLDALWALYCAPRPIVPDRLARCDELTQAVKARLDQLADDQARHAVLREAGELNLKDHLNTVREAAVKLAGEAEPLIAEKLTVLKSTRAFVDRLQDELELTCPACGQIITADSFRAHVDDERDRLQEITQAFDAWKSSIDTLCDTVKSLRTYLGKVHLRAWCDEVRSGNLAESLLYLNSFTVDALRTSCTEETLTEIELKLSPLVELSAADSRDAPPDVQALVEAKESIQVAKSVFSAKDQNALVRRTEVLVAFVASLEHSVRSEIRSRCKSRIEEISADIKGMWTVLHPSESIGDVRLYLPNSADKAIDIGLKFHGIEQDSPRLTLSEGYRNSLGLCIFLALAKRDSGEDRPLFLDDVVVSLDRNHRGMILELLEKEFGQRQVLVFTHDREWYTEMRHLLDEKNWTFKTLLPYETPDIGIRWAHKTTTFADARAHINDRPDSAANDARKIMDVELALVSERLKLRLPYLRADRNDNRMAYEFLERLIADGKKCFQLKASVGYEVHSDAINALEKASRFLVAWANRGSHSFDVVRPEAIKLIDACEAALDAFKCSSCGTLVTRAVAEGPEWVQCQCGKIRWRYGKG